MPTVLRPFVLPPSVNFYCNDESSLTQRVTVYNPYTFDILYKVDNANPQKYSLSIRQGVIASRQKLHLDIACRRKELSQDDTIQVRFFKWPRPRHGSKPRMTQQYIGFREIKLFVYNDRSEREDTPSSQFSDIDVSQGGASSSVAGSQGVTSCIRGNSRNAPYPPQQPYYSYNTGDQGFQVGEEVSLGERHHHRTDKLQVLMNLAVTGFLLVLGFILNQTNEEWFASNVLDGIKAHTLAVVCYTLAAVLIVKLLTFR